MKKFSILLIALLAAVNLSAVTIEKAQGWFESAYVTFTEDASASSYNVYVKEATAATWTKLDNELVRRYPGYGRADALGLKAGQYLMKVVPVISGSENEGKAATSAALTVVAHDRSGFAHYGRTEGVGAYNNDGTLKANARVLYLTANNAKTVKCFVQGDKDVEYTGIQAILAAFEKGKETRPLCIRIIGTIKKADLDAVGSSAEGLQIKGKDGTIDMNITLEGVGNDATVHGFGFLLRNTRSVELRNFASMLCMDDCVSLDTKNHHDWIHNMDFFYGGTGGDADQAKGDGTVDIKAGSSHITVSYNHFFDSGKCSLGGMSSESTSCWMTYHHNWFDHSDSRHPRIRTAFYHCYNNYYDGNAKYGVGVTCGGSSFVESNYFRCCKNPMLISKQGTDAEGDGTFSGENGGVNKAYNNIIIYPRQVLYYKAGQTDGKWDAVLAQSREENITATCLAGGTGYNNAADAEARKAVPASAIDDVADVALICRGEKAGRPGAGRIDGGDFKWTFDYAAQDPNYDVITDLKSAVVNYKSTLIGFYTGTTSINNGGATATVDGGDGKGKTQAIDEKTPKPSWAGGGADADDVLIIGGEDEDFYWFNEANDATTKNYIEQGIILLEENKSSYSTTAKASSSDGTFVDPYVGAISVTKSQYTTFYYGDTITTLSLNYTRSGSVSGEIQSSLDGKSFTKVDTFSESKKGNYTVSKRINAPYARVLNTSGGTLYIHGIKLYSKEKKEPTVISSTTVAPQVRKVMIDGQIYIVRDAHVYNIQGVLIY